MAMATGANFPDGLCGGVSQGLMGSVLLLMDESSAGRAALPTWFTAEKPYISKIRWYGGTGALPETLRADIRYILNN